MGTKKKVAIVFGTRPEAIKMAPVVKAVEQAQGLEPVVIVTAQHREMLDQVLQLFAINPHYDLNIMQAGQTLTQITTRVLTGLAEVFKHEQPDIVLVHGDTTTTFAAGLAAFYQQIPLGHVEAGLRTYHKYAPYPEEMNRRLTGALTDLHFAPTEVNRQNLLREGVPDAAIHVTGNTVIDAFLQITAADYVFCEPLLNSLNFYDKKIIVVEAHRRENLGEPLAEICRSVALLLQEDSKVEIVWPVHKNPRVREVVERLLANQPRIHLIEPLEYADFANLISRAYLIMTDSGGIQEEAPARGVPVVVLREVTERTEALAAGTVCLGGITADRIYAAARELLVNENRYRQMANSRNPYGDGHTATRIVEILLDYFAK